MFDALFTTTTEYKKLSHALSGKGAWAARIRPRTDVCRAVPPVG